MKVLLHTCCAPCMIYPLRRLRGQGMEVEALYFNPNIHPFAEYQKRLAAVEEYARGEAVPVRVTHYDPAEFFHAIHGLENKLQRCPVCWYQRLKETARQAKEAGCEAFTTTLLVSPFQDQEALRKIGSDLAQAAGINFYYEDFRAGFKEAQEQARSGGFYRQKYCGCLYSEIERYDKHYRPGRK